MFHLVRMWVVLYLYLPEGSDGWVQFGYRTHTSGSLTGPFLPHPSKVSPLRTSAPTTTSDKQYVFFHFFFFVSRSHLLLNTQQRLLTRSIWLRVCSIVLGRMPFGSAVTFQAFSWCSHSEFSQSLNTFNIRVKGLTVKPGIMDVIHHELPEWKCAWRTDDADTGNLLPFHHLRFSDMLHLWYNNHT